MIQSREEQIQAAWKRWLDPAANSRDSMTARVEQQIERMDREVATYKAELADLRQELNVIAAYGDKTFHERIRAARRHLWTAEGEDRKAIRLRLAQEFRRRIERIVFNHDGNASVLIHEHGWHIKGEFLVSSERVERLTVWSRDIADQDWPKNPMRPILVVSGDQLVSEDLRDCLGLFATHAA